MFDGVGEFSFGKAFVAFDSLFFGQVGVDVGLGLRFLQRLLDLLHSLDDIRRPMLGQRLLKELESLLIVALFEVRVADACQSLGDQPEIRAILTTHFHRLKTGSVL